MNKEYTYIDGKVIVEDENGNKKVREYSEALDEILVQENIIESMEYEIIELEEESKSYKKFNSKYYIPIILPLGLLTVAIVPSVLLNFAEGTNVYATTVNTIIGPMSKAAAFTLTMTIALIPVVSFFEWLFYDQHKSSVKREKGVNSELEYLKKQIIIEKEKLVSLQKQKAKEESKNESFQEEFKVVQINDLQQLRALRSWINLHFDLGYNGERYYKYLLQGKLDRKLGKYYSEEKIKTAKDYLEEKGPTLVKKRIPSKKTSNK